MHSSARFCTLGSTVVSLIAPDSLPPGASKMGDYDPVTYRGT